MATLRDVANRAGVSPTTASFVLGNKAHEIGICEATSDRVRRCAEELAYHGNYHARALLNGRSRAIGLILPTSLHHRKWGKVAAGVDEAAHTRGNDLVIISRTRDESAVARGLRYLSEKRIDTLICAGPLDQVVVDHSPNDGRVVTVLSGESPFPVMKLDANPGLEAAAAHLADLGHRDVVYLGKEQNGTVVLKERADSWRAACGRHGMRNTEITIPGETHYEPDVEWHLHYCYDHLVKIPPLDPTVTAVMCFNDTVALAFMTVLRERGVRVPQDISLIGFDNLHANTSLPGLTTVSHMFHKMGARAVDVALDLLDEKQVIPSSLVVRSELVLRGSTGPAHRDSAEGSG